MKPGESPALSRNGKVRSLLSGSSIRKLSKEEAMWKLILFLFAFPISSHAEEFWIEPIQVDSAREASFSKTTISEEEILAKGHATAAEALRDAPGIEVARQGGVGQPVSIFIQGARSEDTLVLIDGVEVNDAIGPAGAFDFAALSSENIERIEVYRGPQSVRFGAGALGGVINIVTKTGSGASKTYFRAEGGSFGTLKTAISKSGGSDRVGYSLSVDRFATDGISAADRREGNQELDGAKIFSTSGKLRWNIGSAQFEATARFANSKVDLDRSGGPGGDDPNSSGQSTQFITGLQARNEFFGRVNSSLGVFLSHLHRANRNLPDSLNSTESSDDFSGQNQKIQSDHEFTLDKAQTLRLSLQGRREVGASESTFDGSSTVFAKRRQDTLGQSLSYLVDQGAWFGDLGLRNDQSTSAGSLWSYRAQAGRRFEEMRAQVTASFGTGFKLPSLYQRYSAYGDLRLQAEKSKAWELNAEKKFGDHLVWISFFSSRFRNMIDFNNATNAYFNLSQARSSGGDIGATLRWSDSWQVQGKFSFLSAIDESNGLRLIRRPRHAANLAFKHESKKWSSFFDFRFKGARADVDPVSFARTSLKAYVVANLGADYNFTPNLKLISRIDNLFGQQYQEIAGYGVPGFSYYLGISGNI